MELTWQMYNPESDAPRILVLAGSLGGDSAHQWTAVARQLADDARIAFVYLPGQGIGAPWDDERNEPTMTHLAEILANTLHKIRSTHPELPLYYAGLSLSGALGLYLAQHHAEHLAGVVATATALRSEDPQPWLERADQVEREGTVSLIEATQARWFTEDFAGYEAAKVAAIMDGLASADDHSYAQLCRALATHDISADLQDLVLPILFIAGGQDEGHSQPDMEDALQIMPNADLRVIDEAAHQVPVAAPGTVADAIRGFFRRLEQAHPSIYDINDEPK